MESEIKKIEMRDGVKINTKIKEVGSSTWIIATHGVGEHLSRHNYLNEMFGQYFNVFQYDLRGHGNSEGKRAYVEEFSDYMKDLKELIHFLQDNYRMNRFILLGHSMGALITASFMQDYVEDDLYPDMIFLSAPPAGVYGALGKVVKYTSTKIFDNLSKISGSIKLGGMVDLNYLSQDPLVKSQYLNDDLNELKLHSKLLLGMITTAKNTFSRPIRPKCPAYCLVGAKDRIVCPDTLVEYFGTIDKSFYFESVPEAYHEMHNEIEKYRNHYFDFMKKTFMDCLYQK